MTKSYNLKHCLSDSFQLRIKVLWNIRS